MARAKDRGREANKGRRMERVLMDMRGGRGDAVSLAMVMQEEKGCVWQDLGKRGREVKEEWRMENGEWGKETQTAGREGREGASRPAKLLWKEGATRDRWRN